MSNPARRAYINALLQWRDADKATRGPRPDSADYLPAEERARIRAQVDEWFANMKPSKRHD